MESQTQDFGQGYDGGLGKLLENADRMTEAFERNIAHVEQKTDAVNRYLDVTSNYIGQLRYVAEVARVSVDIWEDHIKQLMDRSAPPVPLQEAIAPPEPRRGVRQGIENLATLLARQVDAASPSGRSPAMQGRG